MEMLGRRHDYCVYGFVFEKTAVIEISGSAGDQAFGAFELFSVDVAKGDGFSSGAGFDVVEKLGGAVAEADDAEADSIVCAEDLAGHRSKSAESGRHFTEEIPARVHDLSLEGLDWTCR